MSQLVTGQLTLLLFKRRFADFVRGVLLFVPRLFLELFLLASFFPIFSICFSFLLNPSSTCSSLFWLTYTSMCSKHHLFLLYLVNVLLLWHLNYVWKKDFTRAAEKSTDSSPLVVESAAAVTTGEEISISIRENESFVSFSLITSFSSVALICSGSFIRCHVYSTNEASYNYRSR